jgi:hypothetical protein
VRNASHLARTRNEKRLFIALPPFDLRHGT